MSTFTLHRQVEYADTDMAGIVHFSSYFLYMEAAEHAFMRSLGVAMFETAGSSRIGWPRGSCAFEYRAPLRFDDEFDVRMRFQKIGSASVTLRAEIVRGGQVCAIGKTTNVCCRMRKNGQIYAVAIP